MGWSMTNHKVRNPKTSLPEQLNLWKGTGSAVRAVETEDQGQATHRQGSCSAMSLAGTWKRQGTKDCATQGRLAAGYATLGH